jgi:hypothetical protein
VLLAPAPSSRALSVGKRFSPLQWARGSPRVRVDCVDASLIRR